MMSEDITFCANKSCSDMNCHRNPKHIRIKDIPHSFALFMQYPKWENSGANWMLEPLKGDSNDT